MSNVPSTADEPRMAALADALRRTEMAVADFRGALKNINRQDLQIAATPALEAADATLRHHLLRPSPTIADDVAVVLAAFKQLDIPAADVEFGRLPNLVALRGARGNVREDFGDVLQVANTLGWRPSKQTLPDLGSAEVSRDSLETALKWLMARMEAVEQLLDQVVRPEGQWAANRSPSQIALVSIFIRDLKLELALAKVSVQMAEVLDLAALGRAVGNVAELTADFVASVRGMATKMTVALREATEQLRPKVREVAHGFRAVVNKAAQVVAQRKPTVDASDLEEAADGEHDIPTEPPREFDFRRVNGMILGGKSPPASWRPWIHELEFESSKLNLAPLATLTDLKSLRLSRTEVTDLVPLAGLSSLQSLDLWNTRVTDLGPLAGLTALRTLNLRNTQVADLGPLASLMALRSLQLRGTHISDHGPLVDLNVLQSLDLADTKVTDLTPIARLSTLQSLNLADTQVSDLAPLAALADLRWLNLANTPVTDLAPLAGLVALRSLDLRNTRVSDLAPLVGLEKLQGIYVENVTRRNALAETLGGHGSIVRATN